jgi:hypothetical protein
MYRFQGSPYKRVKGKDRRKDVIHPITAAFLQTMILTAKSNIQRKMFLTEQKPVCENLPNES